MSAVDHFAGYLSRASDAQLKELTTLHVRWLSWNFRGPFETVVRNHTIAARLSSHLQNMVLDEIESRVDGRRSGWAFGETQVQYPLDNTA